MSYAEPLITIALIALGWHALRYSAGRGTQADVYSGSGSEWPMR